MTATVAAGIGRVAPLPFGGRAGLIVERNLVVYKRTWIVILSGFLEPVFYLLSLGVGLGHLIGGIQVAGHTYGYRDFVAPALLASSAMNGGIYEATFNVFFRLKYAKLYDAVLATPMSPMDIARGEIAWALMRGGLYSGAFLLVMLVLGLVHSWWAVLILPCALLAGFAFAAAAMGATTYMRSWQDFDFVVLATLPLFLFSATFYPLSTYAPGLQLAVRLTPLYQAVALIRGLSLGDVSWALVGHAAYLAALGLVGVAVAARRLQHLLLR